MAANGRADEVHVEVEARLRHLDQRYTRGRRAIIDLLVSAGRPVSISDVAEGLPDLPLSSAYRHLADLQVAGLVRRVAANDEFRRASSSPRTLPSITTISIACPVER